jgi:DNA (cytosine-5)-methyltransferase 1
VQNALKGRQIDFVDDEADRESENRPARQQSSKLVSHETTALFAGIAGFEIGLQKAGHRVSLFCENDPDATLVLEHRFPDVPIVNDVKSRAELLSRISSGSNLVTAGFPCTDLSQAGSTKGFDGPSSRLVREVLELLRVRRFAHVLLENVPNWRSLHGGVYMEEVLSALEKLGYRWAYRTIDALAFGLPQRRKRIFLYATVDGDPRDVVFQGIFAETETEEFELTEAAHGFYWTEGNTGLGWGENCIPTLKGGSGLGIPSPPAILRTNGLIVTPDIRDAEALQGFERGWTDVVGQTTDSRRVNQRRRWLLVGNAVNTRVAAWLGERLAKPRKYKGPPGVPLTKGERFPAAAYWDGNTRHSCRIGDRPVSRKQLDLEGFLEHEGNPLSYRATAGFYSRAEVSRLKISREFLAAVKRHRDHVATIRTSL